MSDTAAELVNLCTDETPPRPTKRIRPERLEPRVLSLVDSDDDSPSSIPRPRDQAGEAMEQRPTMLVHWGAMEDQQVAPRAMVDRAMVDRAMVDRPLYRPPSARTRRLHVEQHPPVHTNPSPIVIEDDDDDADNSSRPATLFRHISGLVREHRSGVDAAGNGIFSSALPSRVAAANVAPFLIPKESESVQQQMQQRQSQEDTDDQRLRLQLQQQQQQQSRRPSLMVPCPRPMRRPARVLARGDAQAFALTQVPGQTQQPQQLQQQQQLLPQEGDAGDHEDADMRLAVRLQAEDDDRLARETARRLEHDEHRRMMGAWSGAQATVAAAPAAGVGAPAPTWRLVREGGGSDSAAPADMGQDGAGGAGSSESAAAALAARWSRLDMLETLESASSSLVAAEAAMARRRAAMAASERDRIGRRNDRLERFAGFGGGGADRDQDVGSMASLRMGLPRPGRHPGSGSMALFGGPGSGGVEAAALAAAAAAHEADSAAAAAAATAAAEVGGGRQHWSSRAALHDMLPAMMALPFGFHRLLGGPGRGDADDGTGAHQAQRRARHAAYREQAMAMREQLMAAQRAGIPAHLLLSDRDFTPEDYELLCRLDERVENRKGAKDEQLAGLPTEVVGAEGHRRSDGSPATCTICMEEVATGDVLKRLPCLHDFHGDCLDTWLKTKACCPICQRGLES